MAAPACLPSLHLRTPWAGASRLATRLGLALRLPLLAMLRATMDAADLARVEVTPTQCVTGPQVGLGNAAVHWLCW
jgi:hypothetical protein